MPAPSFVFDTVASEYDDRFTRSAIGILMRRAVWRRLDARFRRGHRVLELNCGTGEDAIYLGRRGVEVVATDVSPEMVEIASRKVATAGLAGNVEVRRVALQDLDRLDASPLDGVVSNFGGLNCVGDWNGVARALARRLRPGAVAVLCVMGPLAPWEWVWFLARGKPGTAFRRLRAGGVEWSGLTVRYPSIRQLRRSFSPAFRPLRVSAVGALIPPPYTEKWAARHPRLLAVLNRWERRLEAAPPLPWLADHYVLELERV